MLVLLISSSLLVLVGFATPVVNNMSSEDVFNPPRYINLSTINNELVYGTVVTDDIFKSIHKLLISFYSIQTTCKGVNATK